ncbi:hypothetical protein KZZ52_12230 [Dactylosporangium sp. AC04546]|uniref:hypothetical protein n=1 Tax=Dactylosporangium sp. AC04546 TaxID=2862460 RepID=UPI001EE0F213|nr:hypothetical protein [Dactylosporangium sp. AC04546]WVK86107.1 hypothetical protein KZZ52_12230 [Dactylosporangium sp. AC04546]
MTIRTEPIPARTDLGPAPVSPGISARATRIAGAILTAGSLSWSAAIFTVGNNPDTSLGLTIQDFAGGLFQIGIFALLTVQLRTQATGVSKAARVALYVEHVILAIATIWSFLHAIPALRDAAWLVPMDICWPLSMFGMFLIGVKLIFTKRWKGAARVWPFVAETWFICTVPAFVIFGDSRWVDVIGGTHLVIGYATLGAILALKPRLTGAR